MFTLHARNVPGTLYERLRRRAEEERRSLSEVIILPTRALEEEGKSPHAGCHSQPEALPSGRRRSTRQLVVADELLVCRLDGTSLDVRWLAEWPRVITGSDVDSRSADAP